jgi:hypothetical protein
MERDDLERLIDERLRLLPTPAAPPALAARILRDAEQWAASPWYTRAWVTWPVGWRLASVAATVAMLAGFVMLLPAVTQSSSAVVAGAVEGLTRRAAPTTERAELAVTAVRVVWRALVAPIVPYALGLVMVMFLACGLAGTALSYLVFGKAANR